MSDSTSLIESDQISHALKQILQSVVFVRSARQQRFLQYVVNQHLAGKAKQLSGYAIGIEVFDRPPDFDPTVDSIVRVEASRLRSKLREYYDTVGRSDPVRIELPKGGYQPVFSLTESADEQRLSSETNERTSILVVPFTNLSTDEDQEYFTDGMTEDLIVALSKLSAMHVISRQSAFYYKGKRATAPEIGREVGVRYLLLGSVRKAANRIRISAELVVAETEELVWQERYDRNIEDIFAVQDDVVSNIVAELKVELSDRDKLRLEIAPTRNIEAYDLVSRGREQFWAYTPKGVAEARASFTRAIEIDPGYAVAHAWLARILVFPIAFNWSKDRTALDDALHHVKTALRIEPNLPFTHGIASWTHLWRKEIDSALAEGQLAVDLDVNDLDGHMFYSLALSAAGKGDAALEQAQRAEGLSPHLPANCILALGLAHMVRDDNDAAIAAFERGIVRNPSFVPFYVFLASTSARVGNRDKAIAAIAELSERSSESMRDPDAWALLVENDIDLEYRKYRDLAIQWYYDVSGSRNTVPPIK